MLYFVVDLFRHGHIVLIKFPKRKYLGNEVTLTRRYQGVRYTERFTLKVSAKLDSNLPMRGVLDLQAGAKVNLYLEQVSQ